MLDGGEQHESSTKTHHFNSLPSSDSVSSKCTALCDKFAGRSCWKTVLVNLYPSCRPFEAAKVYAVLDDQSNRTLATSELCDALGLTNDSIQYTLSSCSGTSVRTGRRGRDFLVRGVSEDEEVSIPVLIECDDIPNDRSEIPTPDVARQFEHLQSISSSIPSLDPNTKIQLLIGRDVLDAHHVLDQVIGPRGTPFALKLRLGWAIIGEVCLGQAHQPVCVKKTYVTNHGRGTIFAPCEFNLQLRERKCMQPVMDYSGDNVFMKRPDDDQIGMSVEDRQFLNLMDREFCKDELGHWTAPLPFRQPDPVLPNNRGQAWKRTQILDANLRKNLRKQEHFVTFMEKVICSGAAEVALSTSSGIWYLPLFGVYHPRKPNQIRGVFYSSAKYEGVSLNSVLMSGPDFTDSLIGVLLRFRKNEYAVTTDIEQMFYQFRVREEHRDYLRFFGYKNNDLNCPIIEYRMCVHVFGNKPSPSVATYGLRKAVENSPQDVNEFISKDFYVDDGLVSLSSSEQAVDLLKRAQEALREGGGIPLHKITSNSTEVMEAFPKEDLNKNLNCLSLIDDPLPVQHNL